MFTYGQESNQTSVYHANNVFAVNNTFIYLQTQNMRLHAASKTTKIIGENKQKCMPSSNRKRKKKTQQTFSLFDIFSSYRNCYQVAMFFERVYIPPCFSYDFRQV